MYEIREVYKGDEEGNPISIPVGSENVDNIHALSAYEYPYAIYEYQHDDVTGLLTQQVVSEHNTLELAVMALNDLLREQAEEVRKMNEKAQTASARKKQRPVPNGSPEKRQAVIVLRDELVKQKDKEDNLAEVHRADQEGERDPDREWMMWYSLGASELIRASLDTIDKWIVDDSYPL